MFIDNICDLNRRGDINAVIESMNGYWVDKKKYPWHRMPTILKKYTPRDQAEESLSQTLLMLRDAVFGALGMHSLALALNVLMSDVLKELTKGKNWKDGRRKVRNHCSEIVSDMISKGDIRHLLPSALRRDGFSYLLPALEEAHWDAYKKARPKAKKGKLSLKKLIDSVVGRKLLREQGIMEISVEEGTEAAQRIMDAYEHLLVELEVDTSLQVLPLSDTEQITLNGQPVPEPIEAETEGSRKVQQLGIQTPLTDYIEPPKKIIEPEKEPETKRRRRGRRRKKKAKATKGGTKGE